MQSEIAYITSVLGNLDEESTAIIGGAKVSSKFDILRNLSDKVKNIVIGGAMANTFLEAKGTQVGISLYEPDLVTEVQDFLKTVKCKIITPIDVVCAKKHGNVFSDAAQHNIAEVDFDEAILDVGTQTTYLIEKLLQRSKFLLWNGPLGMIEDPRFATATYRVAEFSAKMTEAGTLKSVAGGGDVVSAINACNMANKFTYISTAGGAFLEYIGGQKLPGLEALK
ncbi:UNVERIFIED_CONTAM: hypothetical protein GTU68_031144 [Idotea baltica]|nr:hypothetical protein [Idotea baltica]